jgi:hypothetical protein
MNARVAVLATRYEALRRDEVATLAETRRVRHAHAAARRAVRAEIRWWALDENRVVMDEDGRGAGRTCPRCELLTVRPAGRCGFCLVERARRAGLLR